MEQALFAPGTGYYSAKVSTVGRHGDFSTSATISDLLGSAIAAWLVQEMQTSSSIGNVIEVGGGDGSLSAAVRKGLGWWKRRSLHWHMVETSPMLASQQSARIGSSSARWHGNMSEALEASNGKAFIFHNELLDAFPVRLLQWNAAVTKWEEVWLQKEKNSWKETFQPFEMRMPDQAAFSALADWHANTPPAQTNQRVELHEASRTWMQEWAPWWKSGSMLTIDYGDLFPRVYHRQPRGTVRAYFQHQRFSGPEVYARMGKQDITSDINFSDLIRWGKDLQWQNNPLETQRSFLMRMVPTLQNMRGKSPAAAFLLDQQGAGDAFKVLVQRMPRS